MATKNIEVNGRLFLCDDIYPKFGFYFDEKLQKYAILNMETMEYTNPFVDDLVLSSLPLETWVQDYICVKIDDFYYLSDCNGDCRFQSEKPFIICRNVFVAPDKKAVITKNLEIKEFKNIVIREIDGYCFALVTSSIDDNEDDEDISDQKLCARRILCINNRVNSVNYIDEPKDIFYKIITSRGLLLPSCKDENILTIANWYFVNYIFSPLRTNDKSKILKILNKDFEIQYKKEISRLPTLVGRCSLTYEINGYDGSVEYYSTYFNDKIKSFWIFETLEVVVYNDKTYFFKSDGSVEKIDFVISCPVESDEKTIIYRYGRKLVECDFNGNVISKETLSLKELYMYSTLDAIYDSLE